MSIILLCGPVLGASVNIPIKFGPLKSVLAIHNGHHDPDVAKRIETLKLAKLAEQNFRGAEKGAVISHIEFLVGPSFSDENYYFSYVIKPIDSQEARASSSNKRFYYHKKGISIYEFITDVCEYYRLEWGVTSDGLAIVFRERRAEEGSRGRGSG